MKIYLSIITIFLLSIESYAQSLKATVVDVGAGLCVVLEIPNDMDTTDPYYMLYDVGQGCKDDIQAIIPATQEIDNRIL